MDENEKLIAENAALKEDVEVLKRALEVVDIGVEGMNAAFHVLNEAREERRARECRIDSLEEYEHCIHLLSGLIHYHERMTLPLAGAEKHCEKGLCHATITTDFYLKTLKEAMRLMKRELEAMKIAVNS